MYLLRESRAFHEYVYRNHDYNMLSPKKMYVSHPVFQESDSPNMPIWRYMDFWKFLNLLESEALFFSNSECLGDNSEGKVPSFVLEKMLTKDKENGTNETEQIIDYLDKNARKNFLISSWCYAERESFALWKIYAKDKSGIAIETDLAALKECFNKTSRSIYIGEINYINEKNYYFTVSNLFYPFVTKLDYYSFENEIRCIAVSEDYEKNKDNLVDVDLNVLIKKVHISPNSRPEFLKLIELLKNQYKLSFEICYSKINDSWL